MIEVVDDRSACRSATDSRDENALDTPLASPCDTTWPLHVNQTGSQRRPAADRIHHRTAPDRIAAPADRRAASIALVAFEASVPFSHSRGYATSRTDRTLRGTASQRMQAEVEPGPRQLVVKPRGAEMTAFTKSRQSRPTLAGRITVLLRNGWHSAVTRRRRERARRLPTRATLSTNPPTAATRGEHERYSLDNRSSI